MTKINTISLLYININRLNLKYFLICQFFILVETSHLKCFVIILEKLIMNFFLYQRQDFSLKTSFVKLFVLCSMSTHHLKQIVNLNF